MKEQIKKCAIVGGTHGNELTGVYLVKKFQEYPNLVERSSFETLLLFGNPAAISLCRRYVDKDLNRCFSSADLHNLELTTIEENRAKELNQTLNSVDFILDLHTTTSNMGYTIILTNDEPLNLKLAAYLCTLNPDVRVYRTPPGRETGFLNSVCKGGFVLEIGAISPGILDVNLFEQAEELILAILDYLEADNQGNLPNLEKSLTFYQQIGFLDYPRKNGEIQAMIHEQLQGKDFFALKPGEPIFKTFTGETIIYEGVTGYENETVYPVFINEQAYLEKQIAMYLTQKKQINLEDI